MYGFNFRNCYDSGKYPPQQNLVPFRIVGTRLYQLSSPELETRHLNSPEAPLLLLPYSSKGRGTATGGILSQIIGTLPTIEPLRSTIKLLWTLSVLAALFSFCVYLTYCLR